MAFSNIESDEMLKVFDIAVVDNDEYRNDEVYVKTLDALSSDDGDKLFNIKYTDKDDADILLEDGEIEGYIYFSSNKPNVVIRKNGMNQTVLRYVVNEIEQNKIHDFTVGADPELFLINTKTGKVVSSIGIIPGEKGNPWRGYDMPSGFGLEIDNILAEFNIPPVSDSRSFVNNIEYMKNYISSFVKEKDKNLDILCEASQEVPEDQLQSPEAKMFGCSVDYNVYTERPNPKPQGERTNLRSAGRWKGPRA